MPQKQLIYRGGEDISKVFVISPEHHKSYEKECWACHYHAEASMQGQEVQAQGTTTEEDETPAKKAPEETDDEPPSAPVKPKTRNAGIKGIEK